MNNIEQPINQWFSVKYLKYSKRLSWIYAKIRLKMIV